MPVPCNLHGHWKFKLYNLLKKRNLFKVGDWHGDCTSSVEEL